MRQILLLFLSLLLSLESQGESDVNSIQLNGVVTVPSNVSPAACFNNKFETSPTLISVQPVTNGNIFYAGETVVITSSAPITVHRLTYRKHFSQAVHARRTLSFTPKIGHYFVQSGSDRNEFVVFPSNYGTLTRVGHDDYYALCGIPQIDNNQKRAKLNWVRISFVWENIQITNGAAFHFDTPDGCGSSSASDDVAHWAGRENIILDPGLAPWAWGLSFSDFVSAYSNYLAAIYTQFGTNITAIETINEPYNAGPWFNVAFTNTSEAPYYEAAIYKAVAAAWPGSYQIGPSENSAGLCGAVQSMTAAGGNVYLSALDYHDYNNATMPPDDLIYGVPWRISCNLAASGKTNIFLSESAFQGGSAIGYPPAADDCCRSIPLYDWYRGLCRAVKLATLYQQTNTVMIGEILLDGQNDEIGGYDCNGGIKPKTSAFLITCNWLNNSTPVTNWVSGNLHFAKSIWATGQTNTFVWSSEGTSVRTNLGVHVTDIWSNSVRGPITEEPVIAWNWKGP